MVLISCLTQFTIILLSLATFFKDFNHYFDVWNYSLAQWNGQLVRYEDGKKIKLEETPDKYLMEALWCNWQGAGDFNPPHDHGGDLTWVIYLKIPEELNEENIKTSSG